MIGHPLHDQHLVNVLVEAQSSQKKVTVGTDVVLVVTDLPHDLFTSRKDDDHGQGLACRFPSRRGGVVRRHDGEPLDDALNAIEAIKRHRGRGDLHDRLFFVLISCALNSAAQ